MTRARDVGQTWDKKRGTRDAGPGTRDRDTGRGTGNRRYEMRQTREKIYTGQETGGIRHEQRTRYDVGNGRHEIGNRRYEIQIIR